MADVSHELGSLRFVVDSPLSSKVAMFNNQVQQHKNAQLLNPFSNDGRSSSPKPQFSKDQYGKPLAGSLTEMRGQKANIHVMKEMLELCQIINTEGYPVKDEPSMRVIPFGELFNIYNYISDKVVGILLRARKHKLVEFEGEMLFQRRDDDVPIFLLKPIQEIRAILDEKIEEIKRACSAAPQATSVLLDKSAHSQKLQKKQSGLATPNSDASKSRTPSPAPAPVASKAEVAAPINTVKTETTTEATAVTAEPTTAAVNAEPKSVEPTEAATVSSATPAMVTTEIITAPTATLTDAAVTENKATEEVVAATAADAAATEQTAPAIIIDAPTEEEQSASASAEIKADVNNNNEITPAAANSSAA